MIYQLTVPQFHKMLDNLSAILQKAAAYADSKKFDVSVLLNSRLAPDQFALIRQVQIACDFAKSVPARLAGADVPAYDDSEQSFAELQARIAKTLAFIDGLDAAAFEGSEERTILLRPGTPKERSISGQGYLLNYGLPQFFFHVTTAYALLRHNGVEVGKKDFMGAY